ncbi:hypothetical protein [Alicyclobacillus ferrooxydans]|uniref:Uncharacterized protein n=1 Tax=Alicyclobacillus ferrooxydans TaxID=471514 RepID=A0A0P9C9E0_9BACL|nr:hypothetical protein [Alicyclobacillus ferrooxydans]KPV41972.1 hypothetical protein AN477_19540 [Alicyclobacillus ferrooxydans]
MRFYDTRAFKRTVRTAVKRIPIASLAITAFIGTSGFRFVPDIDKSNHKNIPTYNNAQLNDAKVTPTNMIPRPELATGLMKHVHDIHYAVVIQGNDRLYAGVELEGPKRNVAAALERAADWLARQEPSQIRVYVSADPTLVNHFHRFAADRLAHLDVGSDVVLADIERNFPDANK